jgi:hypothetical protein
VHAVEVAASATLSEDLGHEIRAGDGRRAAGLKAASVLRGGRGRGALKAFAVNVVSGVRQSRERREGVKH